MGDNERCVFPSVNESTDLKGWNVRERLGFVFFGIVAGAGSLGLTYMAVAPQGPRNLGLQPTSDVSDLGKVPRGIVNAEFTVVNRAPVSVQLVRIMKTCRCQSIQASGKTVPPGGTAQIKCRWDTRDIRGRVSSYFDLVYSVGEDGNLRTLRLTIQGEVVPEFDFVPATLEFIKGRAACQMVRLKPKAPLSQMRILRVSCSDAAFSAVLGRELDVAVSFHPELWSNDPYIEASLTITTNCGSDRLVEVPLRVLASQTTP